jgi:hypothetical protein
MKYMIKITDGQGTERFAVFSPNIVATAGYIHKFHEQARADKLTVGKDYNISFSEDRGQDEDWSTDEVSHKTIRRVPAKDLWSETRKMNENEILYPA